MNKRFELQTESYKLLLNGFKKMLMALDYNQKSGMYGKAVQEFFHYMEGIGRLEIKSIKSVDLVSYYEYISTRPNLRKEGVLSSSSVSNHLFSVNLFFDYLLEEKLIDGRVIMPKHKKDKTIPRNVLELDEINLLYSVVENKRDVAILSIAYGAGARRSEIEFLNVVDLQLSRGILIVRKGKFGKRREIPLSHAIIRNLRDYLVNERHLYLKDKEGGSTESFLVNNSGKRMKGDHINERLKELVSKTQNQQIIKKGITLHCLRHSISVHLLDNGASIEFVKDFLGHAEIDTVHIYSKHRKMKELLNKQIQ